MAFFMSLFKPLAYLSLPFLILRSLSQSSPTARYYIRSAAYAGTMATVASVSIVIGVTYNILGKKHDTNHWVARLFYESASRLFNVKVEVEGEELLSTRPAVLMGNHQSFIDILILGRIFPKQASIVSKKSLLFSPLGPFMTLSGAVFVDRGNNAKAVKSLNDASNLIKRLKISIWMFPEGTRHSEAKSNILPLKKGGFHLAINAGIPIIPVVAENYYDLYHNGIFNEGVIKVKVLPPIPTVGLTTADAGDLAIRVREVMLQGLREISRKSADELVEEEKMKAVIPAQVVVAPAPSESEMSLPTSPSSEISGVSAADFGSSASLASSVASESVHSKSGTETEEDEGMILVNRPGSP